jgi:hypothetical protein
MDFASRFLFLQIQATSYSFYCALLFTAKEKGGKKPDRKPHPLPYSLRNPYRNLKSETFKDYDQKPQRNLYVHEYGCLSGPETSSPS